MALQPQNDNDEPPNGSDDSDLLFTLSNGAIEKIVVDLSQTELSCISHGLLRISQGIGNLRSLRKLCLSWNKLTSLPSSIGNLLNLTTLYLDGNNLETIPPEIGNLINLSALDLSNNRLVSIPSEIGNLTNLKRFNLNNNKLTTIPSSFGNLTNLISFTLSKNPFTDAYLQTLSSETTSVAKKFVSYMRNESPLDFKQAENIHLICKRSDQSSMVRDINSDQMTLHFEGNELIMVPPEIGNLSNLTAVYLQNNQLEILPSEIGKLTNLTILNLQANHLTILPPEIGNLSKLETLDLSKNRLQELPLEIANLIMLKTFYLEQNPFNDYHIQRLVHKGGNIAESFVFLVREGFFKKSNLSVPSSTTSTLSKLFNIKTLKILPSIPIKKTDHIDFIKPLEKYIKDTYGDKTLAEHKSKIVSLNYIRTKALILTPELIPESLNYLTVQYFNFLHSIELHFPITENHSRIKFIWVDSFTGKKVGMNSILWEKVNALYNLGAAFSILGTEISLSNSDNLKIASEHFQNSAGTFEYLLEILISHPELQSQLDDISINVVKSFEEVMLGNVQYCHYLLAKVSSESKSHQARLIVQSGLFYEKAMKSLKDIAPQNFLLHLEVLGKMAIAEASLLLSCEEGKEAKSEITVLRLSQALKLSEEAQLKCISIDNPSLTSYVNLFTACMFLNPSQVFCHQEGLSFDSLPPLEGLITVPPVKCPLITAPIEDIFSDLEQISTHLQYNQSKDLEQSNSTTTNEEWETEKAIELLDLKEFKQAKRILSKAIEANPRFLPANFLIFSFYGCDPLIFKQGDETCVKVLIRKVSVNEKEKSKSFIDKLISQQSATNQISGTRSLLIGFWFYYMEKKSSEAIKWYKLSAEQENSFGQLSLGDCYFRGSGIDQNFDEAFKWVKLSADQGNPFGQLSLGYCYFSGKGAKQNYCEAFKWFRLSAAQGNSDAQFNLGNCYENGKGIEQNYERALKWYKLSADQRNSIAVNALKQLEKKRQEEAQNLQEEAQKLHEETERKEKEEEEQKINSNVQAQQKQQATPSCIVQQQTVSIAPSTTTTKTSSNVETIIRPTTRSNVNEVGNWLNSIGFSFLQKLFETNQIDGGVLFDLTDLDLQNIGITVLGQRKKIMAAIRQLQGVSNSTTNSSSQNVSQTLKVPNGGKFGSQANESLKYSGALAFPQGYFPQGTCSEILLASQSILTSKIPSLVFIVEDCEKACNSAMKDPTVTDLVQKYKLDRNEVYSIIIYTYDLGMNGKPSENFYFQINEILRTRKTKDIEAIKGYLYYVLSGLRKLPSISTTVYRGNSSPDIVKREYIQGREICWSGFTSTTTDLSKAIEFSGTNGVVFRIQINTGKVISPFSCMGAENEILIPPNSCLIVTNPIHVESDGIQYVDMIEKLNSFRW